MPVIFFQRTRGKYWVYSANTHRCMGENKFKKINILYPRRKFHIYNYIIGNIITKNGYMCITEVKRVGNICVSLAALYLYLNKSVTQHLALYWNFTFVFLVISRVIKIIAGESAIGLCNFAISFVAARSLARVWVGSPPYHIDLSL